MIAFNAVTAALIIAGLVVLGTCAALLLLPLVRKVHYGQGVRKRALDGMVGALVFLAAVAAAYLAGALLVDAWEHTAGAFRQVWSWVTVGVSR